VAELLAAAERYGPWLVILIYIAYKGIPVAAERLIPDWVANRREAQKSERETIVIERETIVNVYDRFIAQSAENIKFIASAAESLRMLNHSLDENTQQLFHLSQVVEHGGSCPLPDCPYWREKITQPPG
jgi:hypothetical protein